MGSIWGLVQDEDGGFNPPSVVEAWGGEVPLGVALEVGG